MKRILIAFILAAAGAERAASQCAMCRATLETNVSQGDIGIAAGINFGILYLLAIPYLVIGSLAFFWFRSSRKNAQGRIVESAA